MPYKSKDQRQFFLACQHGWDPPTGKKCPPKEVVDRWEEEYGKKKTKKACKRKKVKKLLPLD
jgi:hypothetical protein